MPKKKINDTIQLVHERKVITLERAAMCINCIYSTQLFNNDVLCKKNGVVAPAHFCKKFQMDLTTKTVRKKRTIPSTDKQ